MTTWRPWWSGPPGRKVLDVQIDLRDQDKGAAYRARSERVGALQELCERTSVEDAARLLGMTAADVEDELRVDRAAE
jgi:hypothetical protein